MQVTQSKDVWLWATVVAGLLLLLRFIVPLFLFDMPLGYDPGLYRYLFLVHSQGLPPFSMADIEPWAGAHPLGLFMITSPLIQLGLPVDALIGWVWNLVPIIIGVTYAAIFATTDEKWLAPIMLLVIAISLPFYDGFVAMYWKTYAAFFWLLLSFYALEKRALWGIVPGILVLITHNQTGLLFGLILGTYALLHLPTLLRSRVGKLVLVAGVVAVGIALLVYLPVWEQAVAPHLVTLFTKVGDNAPAGAFPTRLFYLQTYGIFVALALYGIFISFQKKRTIRVWHLGVFWAAVFVVFRLFFYQRFMLQLDFFLLPFIAIAVYKLASMKNLMAQLGVSLLVIAQAAIAFQVTLIRQPTISTETYAFIQTLPGVIPEDRLVLVLENQSPLWVKGWLPHNPVMGPGLLQNTWYYSDWESFILGSAAARKDLLSQFSGEVYIIATPLFYSHYTEKGQLVVQDPCLEPVVPGKVYRSLCSS